MSLAAQDPHAAAILAHLGEVERLRHERQREPGMAARVAAVKAYQQSRFRNTYADLAADARYAPATRFFLSELYGPGDFSHRDAQFRRIVPKLVALFPAAVVRTVSDLARLHALSEDLDNRMARGLASEAIAAADYVRAWQAVGEAPLRELQVTLAVGIGRDLEGFTRMPLLLASLKLMRGPARAAGLSELQHFLESGLAAFRHMAGSQHFLGQIDARERALARHLFTPEALAAAEASPGAALPGQLP